MDQLTALNAADGEAADKCYICLSPFKKQIVASLENCQHVFCIDCILQWSQTANTCPVDRIRFAFIHQRRCPGGAIQKKIKVRTKNREDDDEEREEGSNTVICEECGRIDRGHRLLVCLRCDSGYHMDCLTPSLNTHPVGDWVCAECAVTPEHTDGSMLEAEISDGELTDLLAEVDETASTSSRLRPSTLNRPSGSADGRHSRRIQSRASSDPHPLAQTSRHVPRYLLRETPPAAAAVEVAALHHGGINSAAVKLKTRERRKRAT